MDHLAKHIKEQLRVSLAGVMAVWLSGVVFLLCCQTMGATMPDGDSCPMAKMSSHCDKMKGQNANADVFEAPPVNCLNCGYLPVVFDKTRKIEPVQKQPAPAAERLAIKFDPPVLVKIMPKTTVAYERIESRNKVFVTHCEFRI